jgi:hypothetical protein
MAIYKSTLSRERISQILAEHLEADLSGECNTPLPQKHTKQLKIDLYRLISPVK